MHPSPRLLLLLSLTVFSCGTNDRKHETKLDTSISSADTALQIDVFRKPIAMQTSLSEIDTLTIDKKAAVYYQPDSLQMEKRMKRVGESDFREGMDDYIYYINISTEYLEKQGLRIIDAKNKKYLRFVMTDKKEKLIKLDTLEELWGIYLFDPKKKPHYADIIEIEEDYKKYFK
jgi:hypothetical protein